MKELLSKLEKYEQHDHRYHALLLEHTDDIIKEVGMTSKTNVANLLDMKPQKFSTVFQLLLGYKHLKDSHA